MDDNGMGSFNLFLEGIGDDIRNEMIETNSEHDSFGENEGAASDVVPPDNDTATERSINNNRDETFNYSAVIAGELEPTALAEEAPGPLHSVAMVSEKTDKGEWNGDAQNHASKEILGPIDESGIATSGTTPSNQDDNIIRLLDSDSSLGDGHEAEEEQPSKKQRTDQVYGMTEAKSDKATFSLAAHNNDEQAARQLNGASTSNPLGFNQPRPVAASSNGLQTSRGGILPSHIQSSFMRPAYPSFPQTRKEELPLYLELIGMPTWRNLYPLPPAIQKQSSPPLTLAGSTRRRAFKLSLLNVNEFTIIGLPTTTDGMPTPLTNLRTAIKQISRDHGKAVFERDKEGLGGKWRIPIGAYQSLATHLSQDPLTRVEGIPDHQLKIASLEKARQEKGYPSFQELVGMGVPVGLAKALAPFQRGGVGFVREKKGRALIADDMGLGKTIQGIASMSMYCKEWPVLILTPSTARYHWASEFSKWLGRLSPINLQQSGPDTSDDVCNHNALVERDEIHVLTASKDPVFPNDHTRVVVCSYGLAPTLIANGKIRPGDFKCAIVDESHMLKNKLAKRTQLLIPVLMSTTRCVLLSGTPAMSRPAELWPQLEIIGIEKYGWWEDEQAFINRYVRNASAQNRAELHTLLTGTVMIRRLKHDILKTLPHKLREKASVKVLSRDDRAEFKELLMELKQSKGALGNIARKDDRSYSSEEGEGEHDKNEKPSGSTTYPVHGKSHMNHTNGQVQNRNKAEAERVLHEEMRKKLEDGRAQISSHIAAALNAVSPSQLESLRVHLEGNLRAQMETAYTEGLARIAHQYSGVPENTVTTSVTKTDDSSRKSLLSRLYALTGNVKVKLVIDMLQRWFNDPTKGKVCIFAHHLSVLNAIAEGAGLSNEASSAKTYIRIDGSTSPKLRQQQIDDFQSNPSIRVALLGITAAGVAVTLTASSTVWFAELFWTPALMIQAEDRAHRIGQSSQVKVVYIVARGTLDDVLWKLIEKKFQDLGEFVEGKEKLKMVVHKVYESRKELLQMFHTELETQEDDEDDAVVMDDFMTDWIGDEEFEHDIMSLGEEERQMAKEADAEEDDGPRGEEGDDDGKPVSIDIASPAIKRHVLGKSEDAAITLSSSEESGDDEPPASKAVVETATKMAEPTSVPTTSPLDAPLPNCRLYRLAFFGSTLEVSVTFFNYRLIVDAISSDRIQRFGPKSKPAIGDVLVGINRGLCPLGWSLGNFQEAVSRYLQQPPVMMLFAEVPDVRDQFLAERQKKQDRRHPPSDPSDVIEIDSDDD